MRRLPLVLGYHCLGLVRPRHDPASLVVRPARFRAQVETLLSRGYEFVTVSAFAERLQATGPPEGVCALAFDDGSADNALLLPELLEDLGIPATLFICPGLLGQPHAWLAPEAGVRFMTTDELRAVAGHELVEIGSHTNLHADLSHATADEAYRELLSSRHALEELIGRPVRTFAYPFSRYSAACPAAAERAGYTCAVAGEAGGWKPYELRRESIAAWDRRTTFALKSRGLFNPLITSAPGRFALRLRRATVGLTREAFAGLPGKKP